MQAPGQPCSPGLPGSTVRVTAPGAACGSCLGVAGPLSPGGQGLCLLFESGRIGHGGFLPRRGGVAGDGVAGRAQFLGRGGGLAGCAGAVEDLDGDRAGRDRLGGGRLVLVDFPVPGEGGEEGVCLGVLPWCAGALGTGPARGDRGMRQAVCPRVRLPVPPGVAVRCPVP